MTCLDLSPLPSPRSEENSRRPGAEGCGFVDDSVVMALLAGPAASREWPGSGLVLAADAMDYAGWDLTVAPVREMNANATRRPSPPLLDEAGLGQPYSGAHRWWLAGLAGAASSLLFVFLLLSLAARQATPHGLERISISPVAPAPRSAAPAIPPAENRSGTQLTAISPPEAQIPAVDERPR